MAEQRTLRVPDEPGWWWRRSTYMPGEIRHVTQVRGDKFTMSDCFGYFREEPHTLWRGPVPEPSEQDWEVSE